MGTRGLYGIRKSGIDKATYNHFDSYPTGLGKDILYFCGSHSLDELSILFDNIELVKKENKPTKKQIELCKKNKWFNGMVSSRTDTDWYCLLRNLQGNFEEYAKYTTENNVVYMIDNINFISDTCFCEHAYIINLDDETLEYYNSFIPGGELNNRYTSIYEDACGLIVAIPLSKIPGNEEKIVKLLEESYKGYAKDIQEKINELPITKV